MSYERLESIAAELVGRPFYVLLATDFPEMQSQHITGLYSRRLDLLSQPALEAAGRWVGRRAATYVDDSRSDFETLATFIHELAHSVDLGFSDTPVEEISVAGMTFCRTVLETQRSHPVMPVAFDEQHSSRFVRACIHLWRRLQQNGLWTPPDWLWDGSLYGAPDPITVIRALGDEPDRLLQLPVSLIITLPAPPAFDALFQRN